MEPLDWGVQRGLLPDPETERCSGNWCSCKISNKSPEHTPNIISSCLPPPPGARARKHYEKNSSRIILCDSGKDYAKNMRSPRNSGRDTKVSHKKGVRAIEADKPQPEIADALQKRVFVNLGCQQISVNALCVILWGWLSLSPQEFFCVIGRCRDQRLFNVELRELFCNCRDYNSQGILLCD